MTAPTFNAEAAARMTIQVLGVCALSESQDKLQPKEVS